MALESIDPSVNETIIIVKPCESFVPSEQNRLGGNAERRIRPPQIARLRWNPPQAGRGPAAAAFVTKLRSSEKKFKMMQSEKNLVSTSPYCPFPNRCCRHRWNPLQSARRERRRPGASADSIGQAKQNWIPNQLLGPQGPTSSSIIIVSMSPRAKPGAPMGHTVSSRIMLFMSIGERLRHGAHFCRPMDAHGPEWTQTRAENGRPVTCAAAWPPRLLWRVKGGPPFVLVGVLVGAARWRGYHRSAVPLQVLETFQPSPTLARPVAARPPR